jgi:hypothetical protein
LEVNEMTIPAMSEQERAIRLRLDDAVRRMQAGLHRCPSVDQLDFADPAEAASAVASTNRALKEAAGLARSLERLEDLTSEALQILSACRLAFSVVRDVLTVLSAEIDIRNVA